MENNKSTFKRRTVIIVIFAIAIMLFSIAAITQLPMQNAEAKIYYDYIDDEFVSCPFGYWYDIVTDKCYW